MFSKRSLVRAATFSLLICLYYLIAGILSPLGSPNQAQGAAVKRSFPTTFGAASDLVFQELGIKVKAECNYLTGHESFPVYCFEPREQAFIDRKKVGIYYNLIKFSDAQDYRGEDIVLIYVWRQAIKIECALENKSGCQNVFAFTFWSADLVSSR